MRKDPGVIGEGGVGDLPISPSQITTLFQPIVDLSRGEVVGFEALSRPAPGSAFPDVGAMFDWAEREGALWPLEEVTRAVSLGAAKAWPDGVLLFVNNSPQVFADTRFAETIIRTVRDTFGLSSSRVVLEITERSDQQHVQGLTDQVRLLREHGFRIAIDDVGAGTSGLTRIMALRPDWLKLDRDLIGNIDQDRVRQNLIRFLLHFAQLSGVRLIAEGIERREELATLIELGVPFGQGYYLGRPGSREQTLSPELRAWLAEQWDAANAARFRDPRGSSISRFSRPAVTVDSSQPVRDVAGRLLRQLTVPGVAVLEGHRYVGWCDRDQVLRAAGDVRTSQPIGFLVATDAATATPTTPVAEVLDLALSREDRSVITPLMLVEHGRVVGMLTVRDLLHAAAECCTDPLGRTAPLTGLPSRVRAEERVHELIAEARRPGADGADAVFIDIVNFHSYNVAYGYELGDQLLKRLVAMIHLLVVRGETEPFFAHLGDDRFLVTAPAGRLERRLHRLVRQFDRVAADCGISVAGAHAGSAHNRVTPETSTMPIGLRVLYCARPFALITAARDLFRFVEEARESQPSIVGDTRAPRASSVTALSVPGTTVPHRLSA